MILDYIHINYNKKSSNLTHIVIYIYTSNYIYFKKNIKLFYFQYGFLLRKLKTHLSNLK